MAALVVPQTSQAFFTAKDPGVRGGSSNAGGPIPGLTSDQLNFFNDNAGDFAEVENLGNGLGPRFNGASCGGCHAYPSLGGSSPPTNPQVALATLDGAKNTVPSFITTNGPVREARFVTNPDGTPDGGVHDLFVISGRVDSAADATGCTITQPDFATQLSNNNVIFRIPTPLFGMGLLENIDDQSILANLNANSSVKIQFGIFGHVNHVSGQANSNGNTGTYARTGWKAQDKSGMLFAGEAYNVEMGVTNEIFNTEREEDPNCQFAPIPNDITHTDATDPLGVSSDVVNFATFMRFLAPPTAVSSYTNASGNSVSSSSISNGKSLFSSIGCALCHTPSFTTDPKTNIAALRNQPVNLYSDIAVHAMGPGLADGVSQGTAAGDEFRSAPLWGLGQRIFFLHDGRTSDLKQAIEDHYSDGNSTYGPSEANTVIEKFNALSQFDQQDLMNFLRSL